jgi:psiF repeat
MNKMLALALFGAFTMAGGQALAADTPAKAAAPAAAPAAAAPAANPQQERMKSCNTKADGMKGDDRKKFMSDCLSGKDVQTTKNMQQEKMKVCNKKAEGKKGDERKAFMSDCLKAA